MRSRLPSQLLVGLLLGVGLTSVAFVVPGFGGDATPVAHIAQRGHAEARLAGSGATVAAASTSPVASASLAGGVTYVQLRRPGKVQSYAEAGATFTCPSRAPHAIGGISGSDSPSAAGLLALTNSNPTGRSGRSWDIGIRNLSQRSQSYFLGVVCIR